MNVCSARNDRRKLDATVILLSLLSCCNKCMVILRFAICKTCMEYCFLSINMRQRNLRKEDAEYYLFTIRCVSTIHKYINKQP